MLIVLYVSERPLCSQIRKLNWQKLLLNGGICHYSRNVQDDRLILIVSMRTVFLPMKFSLIFIISLGVFFLCFKLKTKAINSTM